MVGIEFGKMVENLIYLTGQKNYALAKYLGYDVSYISKWISATMLPTSKNIKVICKNIAQFIVKSSTEECIDDIIKEFNIEIECDNNKEEILQKYIEDKLNEVYSQSSNSNDKKNNQRDKHGLNSTISINPRLTKKYLEKEMITFINNKKNTEIILLANIFSLNRESKVDLLKVRGRELEKNSSSNISTKFLMSFDENIEDIIFDTILFINMMSVYMNKKIEVYSCNFSPRMLIVTIKDEVFYTATYTDFDRCLFTNYSNDKEVVRDIYDTLESMLNTSARPMFTKKSSKNMILDKSYMQYIIGHNLEWVIGNINELFMPSDLFLEIGQMVFGDSEDVVEELKKIDAILQNATYNSDLKLLMYESGLRRYISTGKLNFFNVPVNMNFEQRQRHIEYMEKLFKKHENIDVRLINGNLVDDFKNNVNPSIYLSKNLNFLRIHCEEEENKYLIVRDKRLDSILRKFFDEVWNTNKHKITKDREEIVDRISDSLNYARILNENFNVK